MARPEPAPTQQGWAQRYGELLQASELDRETVLAGALQAASQERRGLFSLAQCLETPELLASQIQADYPGAGNQRDVRTYASVLQQDLALNVIAPLTLRLFRHEQAPLPDPTRIFLGPTDQPGQTTSRWFLTPGQQPVNEADFIEGMADYTRQWYPVFRQQLGVSPGAYWSNVGLGLGAPFSVVWNLAEPAALCELAQQWLEQFNNEADRFIDWIPAVFGEQETALPQRKGCCLKYRLPGGKYCGTCGVYRKERLRSLSQQNQNPAPGQWQPGQ
ncbi:MAG: (2Fe-2S)-binding protein [Alteromonadaceae bacterium]|nr:(2Fe-2S)-binding protein [Alteromonadaceae bacterium]